MSQLERVIEVMSDGKERTLRDIEHEIWRRFHVGDTQAAISARLREYGPLAEHGYAKESTVRTIHDARVWFYRLNHIQHSGVAA